MELDTVTRTKIAQVAGTKSTATALNRIRTAIIDSAAAYAAAAINDTFGTALILPKGSRVVLPVSLSNAANTAASTLSLGIRDAVTKVPIDATAILNAASLAAAQTGQFNTGTKLVNGQYYVMPQDVEIYGTFAGAVTTANAAFRAEVQFVAP
ncbi:hypothetical protein [Herbaspirillum autotrophicum]|uniref:hypothetical protein n=1 Tax=Herbaspirillum autotrophicum TaxID=180195 RepID=UPI00067D8980|nr:hypothetical protein [Herbaspirillum autotrophicum]